MKPNFECIVNVCISDCIMAEKMVETLLSTTRRNFSELAEFFLNNKSEKTSMNPTSTKFDADYDLRNFTSFPKDYYPQLLSEVEAKVFWVIFPVVTLVGLLGNALVILAILGNQSMRHSLMNLLLVNLAFADFGNLATSTIDWLQILITRSPWWWLGPGLCPVVKYSEVLFLYASVFFQVAVSIERFIAIIYPLKVRFYCNRKTICWGALFIWLVCTVLAIPLYALYPRTKPVSPYSVVQCTKGRTDPPGYTYLKIAEFLIFYLLPLITFVLLYTKISIVLWHSTAYFHERVQKMGSHKAAVVQIQSRRGIVKMLVWCISIYFMSFSPIQVFFLYQLFTKKSFMPPYSWFLVASGLCYSNSACNPILYTIFSERFRIRFKQILTCKNVFGGSPTPPTFVCSTTPISGMRLLNRRFSELQHNTNLKQRATSRDSLLGIVDNVERTAALNKRYSKDDIELTKIMSVTFHWSETLDTSCRKDEEAINWKSVEEDETEK